MILVDTSVWADHLRQSGPGLIALLELSAVLTHPFIVGEIAMGFIVGEIAMGSIPKREMTLSAFDNLPQAIVASPQEVRMFVEEHRLHGLGIGYVDVHLLASAVVTPETELWTRDKRLRAVAEQFGLAFTPPVHGPD